MIRHFLFSENEAFKLKEFMIRAEKYMPVNFDLFITALDEADANNPHIDSYQNIISEIGLEGRCLSIQFQHPKFLSEQVHCRRTG